MKKHDWDAYIDNMRQCSLVLEHLKNALDFKYNIANNLYALYNLRRFLFPRLYIPEKRNISIRQIE